MIITTFHRVAGEYMGMPLIEEYGLCTNEDATLNGLKKDEIESMEIQRIPRMTGLTVKRLDGGDTPVPQNIKSAQIGEYKSCVQFGPTSFEPAFPKQPFGPFNGKEILKYRKTFIQLEK